jgi:hypothetical protein
MDIQIQKDGYTVGAISSAWLTGLTDGEWARARVNRLRLAAFGCRDVSEIKHKFNGFNIVLVEDGKEDIFACNVQIKNVAVAFTSEDFFILEGVKWSAEIVRHSQPREKTPEKSASKTDSGS